MTRKLLYGLLFNGLALLNCDSSDSNVHSNGVKATEQIQERAAHLAEKTSAAADNAAEAIAETASDVGDKSKQFAHEGKVKTLELSDKLADKSRQAAASSKRGLEKIGEQSKTFAVNTADKIDVAIDCNQICRSKKMCVNKGYNVDSCISACKNKAAVSSEYARQISACESCLGIGQVCREVLACYQQKYCAPIFGS